MVVALDNERAGTAAAFAGRDVAAAAVAESARRGYVDGQALAGVFTWLRPNDLVWNYVVNNYLMGQGAAGVRRPVLEPGHRPARRRPAPRLHPDRARERLRAPGALEVLGTPVDLGAVDLDSYVVAGLTDHIIPWENAYRSTQLLGGASRFVLSTSGHIQALVNPPPPRRAARSYRVPPTRPPTPRDGRESAADAARQLVARLRRVAGRALRRAEARPEATRRRRLQGAGEGAGHLRPRS